MGITIITPTGNRQYAFSLCEKYMSRQSYQKDIQWIVVDDGEIPTKTTLNQTYIRPKKLWQTGLNTQSSNILLSLDHIRYDKVLIIEDDDWYHPNYISFMNKMFDDNKKFLIFGEGKSRYYYVNSQIYFYFQSSIMSNLYQTGFRSSCIDVFKTICRLIDNNLQNDPESTDIFIDQHLWKGFSNQYKKIFFNENLSVGMKEVISDNNTNKVNYRRNITRKSINKNKIQGLGKDDINYSILKEWIGSDYVHYPKLF